MPNFFKQGTVDLAAASGGGSLTRLVYHPATVEHVNSPSTTQPANTDLLYHAGLAAVLFVAFTPKTNRVRVTIDGIAWQSAASETWWWLADQKNANAQVAGSRTFLYGSRLSAERSQTSIYLPVVAGTHYDWRLGYRHGTAVVPYLLVGGDYGPVIMEVDDVGV